jgi:6-phosphogluconolactonase (cycloisomerase 2 family)
MAIQTFLVAALATSASAVKLYVASYADPAKNPLGSVTTLELTLGLGSENGSSSATLKNVGTNLECGTQPTWLDKSPGDGKIYCLNEGFTPPATLNTLTKNADGSLTSIAKISTIDGPVSTQFYNQNSAVALAHYGGSAISTFKLASDGSFSPLQNFTFTNATHGTRPEQEASHVHEAILDPTGRFLLFPDLGSDVVRVYSICPDTGLLTVQNPINSPATYGPRHATFWTPPGTADNEIVVYLFVIHELANRIISYSVTYPEDGSIAFSEPIQEISLYGNRSDPEGTRAAEITTSPDGKFIVASNRNATIFNVPNPDPSNSTALPSDSLVTFKPSADGKLTFQGLSPSGGSFPRHFSFNKDGTLVTVGNQNSQNVFVFQRDVESGLIGDPVASAFGLPGPVTNVLWDEE